MRILTRTIWILSIVSLFNDVASEMLYPVMPIYLQSIGFSIAIIGVLEGVAEATAGLTKGYFGKMSDNLGKRLPFVHIGYLLSAISKPMIAMFTSTAWVFGARTLDRLGKGVRTAARDALLSDESTPETKGRVFGFHRAMDTMGAAIGPALALLYLYFFPGNYKSLFYLAFIPGVLSVSSTFIIRKETTAQPAQKKKTSFFDFIRYWKVSPVKYRKLTLGLLLFALFNSSDVFLLLRIKEAGLNDNYVIGIYIFYNLIFALTSYPLGILADRIGLKRIFLIGLLLFAAVYFTMAVNTSMVVFIAMFFLYGLYAAATEGISKAWITNTIDRKDTATAIGTYMGFRSICLLIASSVTGYIWYSLGSTVAFTITGIATVAAAVYLFFMKEAE